MKQIETRKYTHKERDSLLKYIYENKELLEFTYSKEWVRDRILSVHNNSINKIHVNLLVTMVTWELDHGYFDLAKLESF